MVLRIRGVALPQEEWVDFWIDGDRLTGEPVAEGDTVIDGGWLLPGLLDVHTHPGADEPGDKLDEGILRSDGRAHLHAGVTLIRAPGLGQPPSDLVRSRR